MNNTRVLNCCSCGAGLTRPVNNLVKCSYCGNFNKILPNNVTLTYKSDDNFNEPKSEKKFNDFTFSQKLACVLFIGLAPLVAHRYYKKY